MLIPVDLEDGKRIAEALAMMAAQYRLLAEEIQPEAAGSHFRQARAYEDLGKAVRMLVEAEKSHANQGA